MNVQAAEQRAQKAEARVAELEAVLRPFADAWDREDYHAECHWSEYHHASAALNRETINDGN